MLTEKLEELSKALNGDRAKRLNNADIDEICVRLKSMQESYCTVNTFKVGDLVTQKDGMDMRRYPDVGMPAIVLEVFDIPVYSKENEDRAFFNEALDLRIGVITDGIFRYFMVPSKTFCHFADYRAAVKSAAQEAVESFEKLK